MPPIFTAGMVAEAEEEGRIDTPGPPLHPGPGFRVQGPPGYKIHEADRVANPRFDYALRRDNSAIRVEPCTLHPVLEWWGESGEWDLMQAILLPCW